MPTCYSILPDRFADNRHKSLERGLSRLGYTVRHGTGPPADERDLLITWTRNKGNKHFTATAFEEQGGRVIVAEEAYIRKIGGVQYFALSLHDHNGAGYTYEGGPERWESFGIPVKDWRKEGTRILVREQRGIGSPLMASPSGWHDETAREVRQHTSKKVEIRNHPKGKNYRPDAPGNGRLQDMPDVWAICTWASAIAIESLLEGIPVFLGAPHSIVEAACNRDLTRIDAPAYPNRLPALLRMAWAQWSVAEIEDGTAFARLLEAT